MRVERAFSKAAWEGRVGYCRAIRADNHIYVTGTAPVGPDGGIFAPDDDDGRSEVADRPPAMLIEIEADAVVPRD